MKNKFLFPAILFIVIGISATSCFNDLDLNPKYGIDAVDVYENPEDYINVLAKLYAGLATTGNQGPAGNADLAGIDEGFSQYTRVLWNLQELPTDEAVCAWNDAGIPELNKMQWSSTNAWTTGMYYRIFFQITLCNEFIRQSSDENMSARGFSEADKTMITGFRNEARFLRALSYYHAMDLFGSVPFVDENDAIGLGYPEPISRADLFDYIESELKAIEGLLPAPQTNEYARADRAAAWFLLAKMYLNAGVYTGTDHYTECADYCNKIINEGGYSLEPTYVNLFRTDNNLSNEVIFPVAFDGNFTQTWGGTTFLVHSAMGGTMPDSIFGVISPWQGNRATPQFAALFPDSSLDSRYQLYTDGQTLAFTEDAQLSVFTVGYGVTKWRNLSSTGVPGSDDTHCDTDIPLFRYADVLLMYAECAARGFGDMGTGLNYVNQLRERGYGDASHALATMTPQDVLDERGRELYWECTRRTDLIRFGLFTSGTYVWAFKGGVFDGTGVDDCYNLFPIPQSDIIANPNLQGINGSCY